MPPRAFAGATLAGPTRSADLTLAFELPGLEVSLVSALTEPGTVYQGRAAASRGRPPGPTCKAALRRTAFSDRVLRRWHVTVCHTHVHCPQVDHKARELLLLSAAELKASLVLGSNPASGAACGGLRAV